MNTSSASSCETVVRRLARRINLRRAVATTAFTAVTCGLCLTSLAQQQTQSPSPSTATPQQQQQPQQATPSAQQQQAAPAVDIWEDDFNAATLDATKWERFTFEGGGGGKVEMKDGQLRLRSVAGTRAGLRSKKSWSTDRFYVEGTVAKVGAPPPPPGERAAPLGFATVTILFDGSGGNRLEWLLTSEGTMQAWWMVDGRGERLDNGKLGTRLKNPQLGIARRGDEIYFMLNKQVGLQKTIKGLPQNFTVMLYGFGASENNWDGLLVQASKGS